jgi:tetratricopeptide (TPR) repeat protein
MLHRVPLALTLATTCLLVEFASGAKLARAQPVSEPPVVTTTLGTSGEDLERGLTALQEGRFAEAVVAFNAAYAVNANPAALLNLGIAYTSLGKPHDAARALTAYLEHADAEQDALAMQGARSEIERLRADNGVIQLQFMPAGAQLRVDGEPITPEHGEVLVAPGLRHVDVSAEGYAPFDQTLDVQPGLFTLAVELKPVAQPGTLPVVEVPAKSAAPAIPAQHEPAEPSEDSEPSAEGSCLLAQVCMGPVVSLLGPPNLIGGGLHMRFGRYLGAGLDYQALPDVSISPVTVGGSLFSAGARVYPFGGSFFLGGGLAYQSIHAQFHDSDIGVAARTGFSAATANIGFMGHYGFVLGADIGLLFPLGSNRVSVRDVGGAAGGVSQAQIDETKAQAQNRFEKLLNVMPVFLQVNLIRLGYMF